MICPASFYMDPSVLALTFSTRYMMRSPFCNLFISDFSVTSDYLTVSLIKASLKKKEKNLQERPQSENTNNP